MSGGGKLSEKDIKKVVLATFKKYDTDRSGALDVLEFREFAGSLGFVLSLQDAAELIAAVDTDKNGKIEFDEFYRWWTQETSHLNAVGVSKRDELLNALRQKARSQDAVTAVLGFDPWMASSAAFKKANKRKEVRRIFDEFDTDHSGELDPQEFRAMLRLLGIALADDEITAEFNAIDADHNGTIEFDEFFDFWVSKKSAKTPKERAFYNEVHHKMNAFSPNDFHESAKLNLDGGPVGGQAGAKIRSKLVADPTNPAGTDPSLHIGLKMGERIQLVDYVAKIHQEEHELYVKRVNARLDKLKAYLVYEDQLAQKADPPAERLPAVAAAAAAAPAPPASKKGKEKDHSSSSSSSSSKLTGSASSAKDAAQPAQAIKPKERPASASATQKKPSSKDVSAVAAPAKKEETVKKAAPVEMAAVEAKPTAKKAPAEPASSPEKKAAAPAKAAAAKQKPKPESSESESASESESEDASSDAQ